MQTEFLTFLGDVNDSFWFPEQASTFAENVDWTYDLILWICAIFFAGICACLAWFMIKFSKKNGVKAESQVTHNTKLELAWSILPSFLLVWMFVQGSLSFLDMRTAPEGSYDIGVKAFKWGWTMDYGRGTMHPELHVLKGENTKLTMQSSDVIHSLFIPAFRVKKDVVPGRYNYLWFNPTIASEKVSDEELAAAIEATGTNTWDYDEYDFTRDGYKYYDLFCAEYCGTDHSKMQTVVVVHETREELDAWIKENSKRNSDTAPADWGKRMYEQRGCAGCHSLDGGKRVGPSFKDSFGNKRKLADGSMVDVDENYVRESILNPKAKVAEGYAPVMPSFKGQLSDDDINSIIAFLKEQSSAKTEQPKPKAADVPAESVTEAAAEEASESTDEAESDEAASE